MPWDQAFQGVHSGAYGQVTSIIKKEVKSYDKEQLKRKRAVVVSYITTNDFGRTEVYTVKLDNGLVIMATADINSGIRRKRTTTTSTGVGGTLTYTYETMYWAGDVVTLEEGRIIGPISNLPVQYRVVYI